MSHRRFKTVHHMRTNGAMLIESTFGRSIRQHLGNSQHNHMRKHKHEFHDEKYKNEDIEIASYPTELPIKSALKKGGDVRRRIQPLKFRL